MILKTLIISLVVYLLLAFPSTSFAVGVGDCSQRNDCNDCPSKTIVDCSCKCRSLGNDPNCSSGEFNGRPNGIRCVGDLSCPNLSRCVQEECTCSPGESGVTIPPNASNPPPYSTNPPINNVKMMILGRVFIDNNRNGAFDTGDVYLQSFENKCGNYQALSVFIKVKNKSSGEETSSFIDKCNPEPYYNFFNFNPGNYEVEIILPSPEWVSTTPSKVSLTLSDTDKHVWFGISKEADLVCQSIDVTQKVCLGSQGIVGTSFSGSLPLSYKYESGCLKFSNNSHLLISGNKEESFSPSGLGSCEISVSASIDGLNFVPCSKKSLMIDDCKVSCENIYATPSIIKVGQSSLVIVNPRGEAPFTYSWNSPIPVCRISTSGQSATVYANNVPLINGVESSCPISVNVKDKNMGLGVDCSINVGVVSDNNNSIETSWFKTVGGDVLSNGDIAVNMPEGEYFSSYLVQSIKSLLFDFSGNRTGMERASQRGWKISGLGGENHYSIYNFEYFISNYPPNEHIIKDDLKNADFSDSSDVLISPNIGVSGISINESIVLTSGKLIRYYVNGDLNINNNIVIDGDSAVLFIVRGNLNVKNSVSQISGAFFVNGTVNLTDRINSSIPLTLNGSFGVSSGGKMFGLYRNFELFVFEPKYLVKLLPLFNKTKRVWLEVAP